MSAACPRYGFALTLDVSPGRSAPTGDALWDALTHRLAARGLVVVDAARVVPDGAVPRRWQLTIAGEADQAFDADREAIAAWARACPDVADVRVGPLVDLRDARSG